MVDGHDTAQTHARRLGQLAFAHPWRTYQRLMLARIEELEQRTYHLVAPPGSGKTIIGLEMIRRGGGPAVVFSPTTTIGGQWADKVSLFTPDAELARGMCSSDPDCLETISVFTYQRISTQDATDRSLEEQAVRIWREHLVVDDTVADEAAAEDRLERMRQNNPDRYRREVRNRTRRLRRQLIARGGEVERFLHDNARRLIDDLVGLGVTTVVLDECHHLLDHWAMVVRALLDRVPEATVVGLTATLPDPDDRTSYENYTDLLGDVDFEVPTPAVVREGDLAPWRDLVYFVEPTSEEERLLKRVDRSFTEATDPLLDQQRLLTWSLRSLFDGDDQMARLAEALATHPTLAVAQGRLLHAAGAWPGRVPRPEEMEQPVDFDDRLVLVERFGLDVLALSEDPHDHVLLKRLRAALRGFGLTLTERGLRQGRSAGDLVLALSAAKDAAVVDILRREATDLGERLRAVVITDFATMSSAAAHADGVLEADAGSAYRVFHALIDDEETEQLDPMLVTGSSLLVDADHGDELLEVLNAQLVEDGLKAACRYRPTGHDKVYDIVGEGSDWSSATYVRLITEGLESGATRCLVGTRGLFGEGWDALTLNTLVDLTAVTTSTGVQQLRGRSIRKDPEWPRKVAHNWDVVCVAPDHPRGDRDLQRLVRRHQRSWGVTPPVRATDRLKAMTVPWSGEPASPLAARGVAPTGQIVRGVGHICPLLAWQLATYAFKDIRFDVHTEVSLRAIGDREASYELWHIGGDYDNFVTRATILGVADVRIRTVHTVRDTLRRLAARVGTAAGTGAALGVLYAWNMELAAAPLLLVAVLTAGAVAGTLALLAVNHRDVRQLGRMLFLEQPPDAILRDVGWALLQALQRSGLVSPNLQPEYVRVIARGDLTYEVALDDASEEDAATFVDAYRQLLGPVVDSRYLIRRTDERLPSLPLTMLWKPLRMWTRRRLGRPTYHPVPDVLGTNRDRADALAAAWARSVGGGELVYTRTVEGRRRLLEARAQPRRSARSLAFDRWR